MSEPVSIAASRGRYCPCCRRHLRDGFLPGPDGRPDATCPRCRSLERHRFLAVLLGALRPGLGRVGVLLDVAPAKHASGPLRDLEPRSYVRIDLRPARGVDLQGSLTALPVRDGAVDLLVCYHVLEHVPDDRAAMAEIARVLAAGGLGILQVPWRPGTTTDEDPDAPPEERVRRFGLADHVRYYGDDFEDRLVQAGLSIKRVTPRSVLGAEMSTWLHLVPEETVWIVRSDPGASVPPRVDAAPSAVSRAYDALLGEMTDLRGKLVEKRREVRALRAEVETLRAAEARPPGIKQSARACAAAVRRRLHR